jgi:hypothetical protein
VLSNKEFFCQKIRGFKKNSDRHGDLYFNIDELSDDVFELNDGVYEQIKDFDRRNLTKEQESLVDKLVLDEELKKIINMIFWFM